MLYQKLESPINGVVYKEGNLLRQWSTCTLKLRGRKGRPSSLVESHINLSNTFDLSRIKTDLRIMT